MKTLLLTFCLMIAFLGKAQQHSEVVPRDSIMFVFIQTNPVYLLLKSNAMQIGVAAPFKGFKITPFVSFAFGKKEREYKNEYKYNIETYTMRVGGLLPVSRIKRSSIVYFKFAIGYYSLQEKLWVNIENNQWGNKELNFESNKRKLLIEMGYFFRLHLYKKLDLVSEIRGHYLFNKAYAKGPFDTEIQYKEKNHHFLTPEIGIGKLGTNITLGISYRF